MQSELLERAVKETSDVLQPILEMSYATTTPTKQDMLTTAIQVNQKLGYKLFDDLYYARLVHDFALVSRTVAHNAIHIHKKEVR